MTTAHLPQISRRGRRKTGTGTQVQVRFQRDLLAVLDKFIADHDPEMSRPEALRLAFTDWAVEKGLIPHCEDIKGATKPFK